MHDLLQKNLNNKPSNGHNNSFNSREKTQKMLMADTVVVLDFETTGLSPDDGERAIEIGAVKLHNGEVVDRFQALMNPGQRVSAFIEDYTGISNSMLADADTCAEVMHRFADFIDGHNLVAHNASFDKRFLDAELLRIARSYGGHFSCSLLAARRIFQQAPNHKLGTLVKYANIPCSGDFHRALYDSEMTVQLWLVILKTLRDQYQFNDIPFSLIQQLNKTPKKAVYQWLARQANG
ncbi:MAG: DNA polymerase-3 subunit epsilon [Pseudohongiellaceae bacterium]|jgi:DNA polymerase-3 subunit epsilon